MAQEEPEVESASENLDQSQSSSDPSLSRNVSFSKLNAQAPEFVPTRSQQQPPPPPPPPPRLTVVPPPPPPAAMMHIYPPPPPSPFHVPIHSPVPVPHVIPVQNHHPHPHPHHHNHHQHQHHNQQYVPLRNHSNHHHGQNSHYMPMQYHGNQHHQNQNHYAPASMKGQSEEEVEAAAKKDVASSDHASKADRNGLSDEAVQKLLNQVEYYFSDLNLATTDHLMRFIQKDAEGYVPISVVASFKKIKAAINSNSQLASILRNSSKLVVSEDGKKVRRQHPLTQSDVEELQSRIVVTENLPEDHCHQNLMKIFSTVGSVKTIRTCPPQTSGGGASASRSSKADGMHFSNKLHAFVEYESVEIAEKAVIELNDEENWRSGLKVRLMLKRTSKPTQARGKKGHDEQGYSEEDEACTPEQQLNEKQNEDPCQQYVAHSHELSVSVLMCLCLGRERIM
ncbi:la-related protein 6B isoform X2 [Hevea brasiliensis]|uniref:la-related protein 6B isoform X2 n=1 Tax=Hevea brasiliensis TaxID=3981 RepID=UPI0025EF0C6E|nr:la-related protein 6B isoform X2 [Hevea brasiliensis]